MDLHEKIQSDLKPPSDVSMPSRIIVNYLSKYFNNSDRFVKIKRFSNDVAQNRLQSTLIDTIIQDEKLMNFTFQLTTVESSEPILKTRNMEHLRRSAFHLLIVDSIINSS